MTSRDSQLKAYREYQEAVQKAEEQRPRVITKYALYEEGKEDIECGIFKYDLIDDCATIDLPQLCMRIDGKYLKAFQAALNSLMGDS
jgi:hypothetical protein